MSRKNNKIHSVNWVLSGLLEIALVTSMQACSPSRERIVGESVPSPVSTLPSKEDAVVSRSPTPTIPTLTDIPVIRPEEKITPSATLALVTVTAVDGDLAIRTGPDMVFDAIDTLHKGETVQALARSVLDGWVQIPIPSQPGKTGWVSIQTRFSVVSGEVLDLPKIMTVEWPVGSYLRNCTSHQLIVEPGGKILAPLSAAPANRVWFFPGLYTIYDLDVAGRPEVTGIKLWEHTEVDIVEDGSNQRGECP